MTTEYKVHPAAELFPMMGETELAELAEDIRKNGLVEPILLYKEEILDGRNRLAACKLAGVEPRFANADGVDSPVQFVTSKNLYRRHLSISQRGAIAGELAPMLHEEALGRQRAAGACGVEGGRGKQKDTSNDPGAISGDARDLAGKLMGVSGATVQHAIAVKAADPDEFERIKRGEVTVGSAYKKTLAQKKAPSTKQEINEKAAKRRMIALLSASHGACRGLELLDVSAVRNQCTPKEIATWSGMAQECSSELNEFSLILSARKEKEAA